MNLTAAGVTSRQAQGTRSSSAIPSTIPVSLTAPHRQSTVNLPGGCRLGASACLAEADSPPDIYAETSSFEVKPKGSTYPSQSSPSTSASVTGGVSVPSGSSSATAPSDSGKGNGAESLGADGICQAVLFSVVVMLGVVHWA